MPRNTQYPNPNRPQGQGAFIYPNDISSIGLRRADPSINNRFKGLMDDKNAECAAAHGGDTKWKFHFPSGTCRYDADNDGSVSENDTLG